jgi:hypothetical protein
LTPPEVIGRDSLIEELWEVLARQSILLTSERRMGKTSVMQKMLAEPVTGFLPIKRSLQGITSPDEFVRGLVADIEMVAPGVLKRSIGERLYAAGIKQIDAKMLAVEFSPASEESWKDVIDGVFGALDEGVDEIVVFLWDELPHMVADIAAGQEPRTARKMLDVLRAARERHTGMRMVLSGSLGIHHVIAKLLVDGGMWMPTHDMLPIDVPPLSPDYAVYLATELLRNEKIACDGLDRVAVTIAAEVDDLPYYVHHVVKQLQDRQRAGRARVDPPLAEAVVADAVTNPLDPWQLKHYLDRTPVYYGERADLANQVLDVIAASEPPDLAAIENGLAALGPPPEKQDLTEMLDLLCRDYYIEPGPPYRFRRDLVRRAWRARRPNP